jgi:hypothetical protein
MPTDVMPWRELETSEGEIYYHNDDDESLQWAKPDELKTASEKQQQKVS